MEVKVDGLPLQPRLERRDKKTEVIIKLNEDHLCFEKCIFQEGQYFYFFTPGRSFFATTHFTNDFKCRKNTAPDLDLTGLTVQKGVANMTKNELLSF